MATRTTNTTVNNNNINKNHKSANNTHKTSVDELDGCRVFKEVLPFWFMCHDVLRNPAVSHLGKRVVHQTSIKAGHKRPLGEGDGDVVS